MKRQLSIFILLLIVSFAKANVITVTTIADAGAGSLREALQTANANGTAEYDTIAFLLPTVSGNLINQRTIFIYSELPRVTSKVIIDGTTQPGPTMTPTTQAKVSIFCGGYNQVQRGLVIIEADHVEIYGMYIGGFSDNLSNVFQNPFPGFGDGIYMHNVSDIKIGAFGKSNTLSGNYYAIRHDESIDRPNSPDVSTLGRDIIIQSNVIGKEIRPVVVADGNINGILLVNVSNVVIGGESSLEGNEFKVYQTGIEVIPLVQQVRAGNFIRIKNNSLTPPKIPARLLAIPFFAELYPQSGIIVGRQPVNDFYLFDSLLIEKNAVRGFNSGMFLVNMTYYNGVFENVIDTANPEDPKGYFGTGVLLNSCDKTVIGGRNDSSNYIRKYANGVRLINSQITTITRNKIICTDDGITHLRPAVPIPFFDLPKMKRDTVWGKTCANCKVEMFSNVSCVDKEFNGENFDTTFYANANGDFRYVGRLTCLNSFTSTSPAGLTTEFKVPKQFLFNDDRGVARDDTCSRGRGGISGLFFYPNTTWVWQNQFNVNYNPNDSSPNNLPSGDYYLVSTHTELGCVNRSKRFRILDHTVRLDASSVQITNPSTCNPNGGALRNFIISGTPSERIRLKWFRNDTLISTSFLITNPVTNQVTAQLLNIRAGIYKLNVSLAIDSTCNQMSDSFHVILQLAPYLDSSRLRIVDDSCSNSGGSIQLMRVVGQSPNYIRLQWQNVAGNIVSNSLNATNLVAGRYRFVYEDNVSCGLIYSNWYVINGFPGISLDERNVIIKPAGCTIGGGSINGIIPSRVGTYSWINTTTNQIVSNQLNPTNLPAGSYQMTARSASCTAISRIYTIGTTTFIPLIIDSFVFRDATCNLPNGFIRPIGFINSSLYRFAWQLNNNNFSNQLIINNLNAGNYQLTATDSNGCSSNIYQKQIAQSGGPKINRNVQIANDTCSLNTGRIFPVAVNLGQAPYRYQWSRNNQFINFNTNEILAASLGTYQMVVTDANGCADTSLPINIVPVQQLVTQPRYAQPNRILILKDSPIIFTNTNPSSIYRYNFYDANDQLTKTINNGSFVIRPRQDTSFSLRTQRGTCFSSFVKFSIKAIPDAEVNIVNAFSPNGDGINDFLQLQVKGVFVLKHFEIFNRYGQLLFETNRQDKIWTGKLNGNDLPVGTYYYILEGSNYFGKQILLKGSITLLR